MSLGEYRQLQFIQTPCPEAALNSICLEFCGQDGHTVEILRADFFKLKCGSLDRKDLKKHFKNITKRFYQIGGYDDPHLKQTFLSSVPEPLGDEAFKLMTNSGKELRTTTLGELFQLVLKGLEKMCS